MRALIAALAAACVAVPAGAGVEIPADCFQNGFAIGCQAYTFKEYSLFEAIDKTKQAGGKVIELYPDQKLSVQEPMAKFSHNSKKNMRDKVKAKLKKEGIIAVNYGVVNIPKDEAEARKVFEFAKDMGLYGITTESDGSIDTIEKLVKEFDIRVGYHEHARRPNDPNYRVWDPKYIAALVKDRDPRIGACADTGHWQRSGLKPVECLKILEGRIISVHLKDLNQFGEDKAHDVHWGKGKGDVPGVLAELKRQGLKGNISVEYEYNWKNNVEDAKDCIEYVRNWKP